MTTLLGELNRPLCVQEMLDTKADDWDLIVISGGKGLDREVTTYELARPGLALAGYFDRFSFDRIQLIGLTESAYIQNMNDEDRSKYIRKILSYEIPCIIVTSGNEICAELEEGCETHNIPLLRTSHLSSPLMADLSHYLEHRLAPSWTLQGTVLDIFGLGVLIRGRSGIGKSEVALELIDRGHRLVGDDIVVARRVSRNRLIAQTPPNIGYHMEIRGIGIIDVELLFGVRAIRMEAEIAMLVTLEQWVDGKDYERLGIGEHFTELFECHVPEYVIPVEPGRSLAKLIEVATLTQRLENQGVNVAQEFEKIVTDSMDKKFEGARVYHAIDRLHRMADSGE